MDRQELQARRGENQVWNGSGNYAVKPDYLAFDPSGDPELYWNTVTGAAARRYDFTRFQPLLHAFQQQPQGDAYAEVFFLALESARLRLGAAPPPRAGVPAVRLRPALF